MTTRDPETIRSEIEETREQLGETVEALADKADVKSHAKAKVEEIEERAMPGAAIAIGVVVVVIVGLAVRRRRRR